MWGFQNDGSHVRRLADGSRSSRAAKGLAAVLFAALIGAAQPAFANQLAVLERHRAACRHCL
jgi:hypothetical protein